VLSHARLNWLLVGFATTAASTVVTATNLHGLLRAAGVSRSWLRCQRLELAGDVFDAALPTNVGGDVVRAVYAAEAPAEQLGAASAVVLRRVCNLPGMLLLMAVALVVTSNVGYAARARPWALLALVGGLAACGALASPLLGRVVRSRLLGRARLTRLVAQLAASVSDLRREVRAVVREQRLSSQEGPLHVDLGRGQVAEIGDPIPASEALD